MLPVLLETPKDELEWSRWSFHNRTQIDAINQAILTRLNVRLPSYLLDPINFRDFQSWLQNNQAAHSQINSTLGLAGSDLEELDPKDRKQLQAWIFLNYQELYTASAALGI